jgi:F-type H+-transporting ATPase subunit b
MEFGAAFWVGLAFVVFLAIVLIGFKVHRMVLDGLDERARKIADELEQAQRLREEAQALLASYERKQRDAAAEAEAMLQHAREEARREAEIAQAKLEQALQRREELSLEKIALAETQAAQEVRDAAIDAAIEAARQVIESKLDEARASGLVDEAIGDLRRHLN